MEMAFRSVLIASSLLLGWTESSTPRRFDNYPEDPFSDQITEVTHCVLTGKPLVLMNPFNFSDHLSANQTLNAGWIKIHDDFMKLPKKLIEKFGMRQAQLYDDRLRLSKDFDLTLNNVNEQDYGLYETMLTFVPSGTFFRRLYNVTPVLEIPKLKSPQLTVKIKDGKNGSIDLECGSVASFGNPPVTLVWVYPDGTRKSGTPTGDGSSLKISTDEVKKANERKEKFVVKCEVDRSFPSGAECVDMRQLTRWKAPHILLSTFGNKVNMFGCSPSLPCNKYGFLFLAVFPLVLTPSAAKWM